MFSPLTPVPTPPVGSLFLKEGKRWRVTSNVADICTIKCKTETRILSPRQLHSEYRHKQ